MRIFAHNRPNLSPETGTGKARKGDREMRMVAFVVHFRGAIHPLKMGMMGKDEGEFAVHLGIDVYLYLCYLSFLINKEKMVPVSGLEPPTY